MRLDLGGGTNNTKAPGHINIDLVSTADIVWDLNLGLPRYPNLPEGMSQLSNVDGIRCHQLVEHLDTVIPLFNDCYEVMKPGAIMEISTPKAFTDAWAQDPTHKKMFVLRTFDYFCDDPSTADAREEYGITSKFKRIWWTIEHGWNLQVHLQK